MPQPAILRAMPGRVVPAIEVGQLLRGRARRPVHLGADVGGQQILKERILHVLDQVLVVDRHRRAEPTVRIGVHQRRNRILRRMGIVKCVVVHGGDAALELLDRAEHRS